MSVKTRRAPKLSAEDVAEESQLAALEERYGEVEQWRPAPGLGGKYEISSFGRVFDVKKGRAIFVGPRRRFGYGVWRSAASLVAEAFVGPPSGKQVRYRDGNTKNLFWRNLYFAFKKVPVPVQREAARRAQAGEKHAAIALALGISEENVGEHARAHGVSTRDLHRNLSAEEKVELIRRVDAGEPYPTVAFHLKVCHATVGRVYRAAGKVSPRYRTDITTEQRLDIARRCAAGESRAEIGRPFKLSRSAVRSIMVAAQKRGEL